MTITARFRGHEAYFDPVAAVWRYLNDGTPIPDDPLKERPCPQCHLMPTLAGHDGCIGEIPGAISACCGHGVETGYVVWEASPDIGVEWYFTTHKLLLGVAAAIFFGWLLGRWGRGNS